MAAMSTVVDFQNCCMFILLCFFPLLCYSVLFMKPKDIDLTRSPPSFPIIGHFHLLLSTLPHKSFQRISTKYGPLLHLRFFSFPIVLVSSPSVAYEIYTTHDLNVSSRSVASDGESLIMGSDGIVSTPYNDYFKFIKKLVVTKLLRPQAIEQSRHVRATELQGLYTNLLDKATKKESVEIGKEAMKLTVNMICGMTLGKTRSEDAERFTELILKSFALTKKIFFSNIFRKPLEKLGISLFRNEIMGASRGFDELLERILVEHEEKHQDGDLMDSFLEAYRDENA
ncbi:unnamed protein product [Microthlaspi erraticum]|uniref:Cytochrome P450 n=1 Tax=Microthlaspi erraticum TaxID=1685480 RepID=A0A6D2KGB8_9BRAS|nr:unnamed protein product [Microthlaspi erraticum]